MTPKRIGRYEILETLGRGAMGVVYLARDPIIDRRVALKTLRLDLDEDVSDEFRERFFREAQAAGRLNHPGIVTVHDVGEDTASGLVYIAMEYVEGRDLKQLMADGRKMRPSEAARIAAHVAMALDYAHSMGVVHRDIKPANILVSRNGSARITDFGIARLESSSLTVDGQFIGTPNFMSPEQVAGRTIDGRSDLFSLGVVLFYLLTGHKPFAGATMHEVTMKIVQDPPPIPSTLEPGVPPAFNPIILKCLQKEPDARFQNGAELARVLGALARSLLERDEEDPDRTDLVYPDLETRVARDRVHSAGSARQPRLTLPEPLTWPVEGRWAAAILGGLTLTLAAVLAWLGLAVDSGPFPAPSASLTRALHQAASNLQQARVAAADGHLLEAEQLARRALDQAPGSPQARRLLEDLRRRLEQARTSAEAVERADALVAAAREAYRAGDWSEAASLLEEALELVPDNELAASYLELAQERLRSDSTGRTTASRDRVRPRAPQSQTSRPVSRPTPRPTPGTARVTVFFNSPLNAGAVRVLLDGEAVAEIPFDFSRKGFLGIQRKGSGTVKRVMLVPSGTHRLGVELLEAETGVVGSRTFRARLDADSDWTLRIDLPEPDAEPGFFLVRANR